MARIRTQSEIISSLLDFFRVAQPALDTKPGTVARDLAVEGLAAQIARLYEETNRVSNLQSLRLAIGADLEKLGSNYGIPRGRATKSVVPAVFTFSELNTSVPINKGDVVTARNGATFVVINGVVVSSTLATGYRANAARIRADLDAVGITDEYAVEVLCECTSPGTQGNITKYALVSTNVANVSNVTNVTPGSGGRLAEDDATYRNRILSVFSGANTGTATGYRNAVLSDDAVRDAIVIEPGDPLMTRDGTQVSIAADGTRTITKEGAGGRVDIFAFGQRLQEVFDTFVYRDKSNTGDPTNSKNDYVMGQIAADANKTVTRKRLDNLAAQILPTQPVNNIIEVSGTGSGANFLEETIDSYGRSSGNYRLVRDTGAFAGSPWGFDRLHWIDNKIRDYTQDQTKGTFNGQDALGFTDVTEITGVVQNIQVTNENSRVEPSNRSSIQLAHYPATGVTRVFNVTTGERYTVADQNLNASGINTTGKITISGRSLPAISDILQVDYTWVFTYDPYFDYDNRLTNSNPRAVQDSVDWGFSNMVRREMATLTAEGSFLSVTTSHPISAVVTVNTYESEDSEVTLVSGRLAVVVSNSVTDVISIRRASDDAELWSTNAFDGTFSGLTVFLPTDTSADFEDAVSVVYNTTDVYNATTPGSFSGSKITIAPESDVAEAGMLVECTYVANVSAILPATALPSLPALRSTNAFDTTSVSGVGSQPTTHLYSAPGVIVQNLRQAPTNLGLTIAGSISPGVITVSGTTITLATDIVFTVSTAGLKQDLTSALRTVLSLNSKTAIPSAVRVARICKVEKVTTSGSEVITVDHTYDIKGYSLLDNTFVKDEAVADATLRSTEFVLPDSENNADNAPEVGNRLRVTFHYTTSSDSENVSFTKSGTLYTNKRFAIIDSIAKSSGFTSGSSATATLTVSNLNQPATRSRYKVSYDYIAPKTNERITIRYNYDRLITDATLAVEATRPINADVLVKASIPVSVDVVMKIGVTDEFVNSSTIVLQNVQDAVTSALNQDALGTKVDSSDLVNQAYTVNGVDSARVTFFNKSGNTGSVLSVTAQKNEYIRANVVTIELE